ncbi:hypothetical protein [Demequina aestuarii]|uniref:hypothetical protein n=1 Tax=Demequina aestuarii TaxID=327095 RepID=UPI000AB82E35|nr:hypothetical protein [Demequina aestuarii]
MGTWVEDAQRSAAHWEHLADQSPSRYTARWAWAIASVGSTFAELGDHAERLIHFDLAASIVRARVDAGVASDEEQHDLPAHLSNLAAVALQVGELDLARRALREAEVRWASLPEHLRYSRSEARFEDHLAHVRARVRS